MRITLICLLLISVDLAEDYQILGIFPIPGYGHMHLFERLMKGLAKKGHQVDVMSHFPQKQLVQRYNDISIRGTLPILVNNLTMENIRNIGSTYFNKLRSIIVGQGVEVCKAVLNSNAAKELKNSKKKYDLVITEIFGADCMLGFGHHFNVPVISVINTVDLPWGGDRIGNSDNPSYIPNFLVPYSSRMSFLERLINTVILVEAKLTYRFLSIYNTNEIAQVFFGPDFPDLQELIYNTSLILVNSHFSFNLARPLVPNLIEIGGLHIGPENSLPKHFEDSLNVVPEYEGVIYFAMGSMVLSESFPLLKLNEIFEAFKELPYKVMWKADKESISKDLDVPSNIQFESWMPQVDILCNPNVKLFVTHGGLMSTQEGIFCGVPSLGIPLFGDQTHNLKLSEKMGIAIIVDYDNITKDSILNAARTLLADSKYKSKAQKMSKLFRDRPLSPLDTAIYWIEYIIKHNGAPHLRTVGADLPWYQYYLIDVGAVLLLLSVTVLTTLYYSICGVLRVYKLLTFNDKSGRKSKQD